VATFGFHSLKRLRRRGWLSLALSLVALATAAWVAAANREPPAARISLTAGPGGTTRALYAEVLARQIGERGTKAELVATDSTGESFRLVDAGKIDFALVSGAIGTDRYAHVREVTPLFNEALHLLVKQEMAESVERSLGALRGHTVNLGPTGSATAALAVSVLTLAEVPAATATEIGYIPVQADPAADLARRLAEKGRDALPDAVFDIATVPSTVARAYVQAADYQLVGVPFADAFRLSSVFAPGPGPALEGEVERHFVFDAVIPRFTYQIEPPVPAENTHTLGVPVYLIANDSVSDETVERVMEAVFDSQFARMHQPPIDRSLLSLPSHIVPHPGSLSFRLREKPLLTADDMEELSNGLSVFGALAGAGLFFWQAWRQRRSARRRDLLSGYLVRVAELERRLVGLELSSTLELDALIQLQQDLLRLKSEALDDFAAGRFEGQAVLFDLLGPINAAREHLGRLLLHVRETIETQAEAEGRAAGDLWESASELPSQPARKSRGRA
jgi:TRAP-type uncharacterized transport system substrate-binding protein